MQHSASASQTTAAVARSLSSTLSLSLCVAAQTFSTALEAAAVATITLSGKHTSRASARGRPTIIISNSHTTIFTYYTCVLFTYTNTLTHTHATPNTSTHRNRPAEQPAEQRIPPTHFNAPPPHDGRTHFGGEPAGRRFGYVYALALYVVLPLSLPLLLPAVSALKCLNMHIGHWYISA